MDESPIFILPSEHMITISEGNTEVGNLVANDFYGNLIDQFSLVGVDKDFFMIHNGKLMFRNPVDFETQSSYLISIIAIDEFGNSKTETVTIEVQDGK